jgi:hypothetical protein
LLKLIGGLAAAMLVCVSLNVATAQTNVKCSKATGPVVWYVPATQTYYVVKTGAGDMWVCRATAISLGAKSGDATSPTQGGNQSPMPLGGHFKTGHTWPLQNRPEMRLGSTLAEWSPV